MLRQLGHTAVRLLTNNPEKMSGLEQCGIRVIERVPHISPSNEHNTQHLVTKARRFGHMFWAEVGRQRKRGAGCFPL